MDLYVNDEPLWRNFLVSGTTYDVIFRLFSTLHHPAPPPLTLVPCVFADGVNRILPILVFRGKDYQVQ